jgi:hypothetical protein
MKHYRAVVWVAVGRVISYSLAMIFQHQWFCTSQGHPNTKAEIRVNS